MAISLREIAVQALVADAPCYAIMNNRYLQQGSMDRQPDKPYTVVKFGLNAELNRWRQGPRETLVELWVHDDPGDYNRIDQFIEEAQRVFAALESNPDSKLIESRWTSTSQDFEDIELGTILRVATFQWTLAPLGG